MVESVKRSSSQRKDIKNFFKNSSNQPYEISSKGSSAMAMIKSPTNDDKSPKSSQLGSFKATTKNFSSTAALVQAKLGPQGGSSLLGAANLPGSTASTKRDKGNRDLSD